MKKIILLLLAVTSVSMSQDYIDATIDIIDNVSASEQKLRSSNAMIKSQTDLNYFSGINYVNFPLNYLNPKDKAIFVKSLTFSKKGLSSYNYQVLEDLADFDKVYKILSLFGMEKATSLTISSPSKWGSVSDGLGDVTIIEDSYCHAPATCKDNTGTDCVADNC